MRRVAPILALIWLAASGCQDYLFEQVCPQSIEEAKKMVMPLEPQPADILFIVDDSCSMADEQANLAANFDRFINAIIGTSDYRIAVATTDVNSAGGFQKAGLSSFMYNSAFPYEANNIDQAGCTTTNIQHGCFRGPDAATRIVTSAQPRDEQLAAFRANISVGSCGSGTEQGLQGMIEALENTDGGCNDGFLRAGANLIVIIVSDEEDFSGGLVNGFINQLGNVKSLGAVRVAAIVGAVDGVAGGCKAVGGQAQGGCGQEVCTSCPGGGAYCNDNSFDYDCGSCTSYQAADCCNAVAGNRYVDFANRIEADIKNSNPAVTTAVLIDSICQDDFGDTLERIATQLVVTDVYPLDPPAIYPPGVSVTIVGGRFGEEGQELAAEDFSVAVDGTTGYGTSLSIVNGDFLPRDGEELQISFVTEIEDRTEGMPYGACGAPAE